MRPAVEVDLATRRATKLLAQKLARALRVGDLIVFAGPLGAGKTFFVRALCRALGLPEREPVTSPTFTLIQEIETEPPIAHADVYRLQSDHDVRELGLDRLRDGRAVLVEWGVPYIDTLGGDALVVELSADPKRAQITATGARSEELLKHLSGQPVATP